MKIFELYKEAILKMSYDDHKSFVKALLCLEKGIDDEAKLDWMYARYMDTDDMGLLSDDFDFLSEVYIEEK